jgi:hypothetical protein
MTMSNFLIIIFYEIDKVYMYTISHVVNNLYKKVSYDTRVSFYTRLVIFRSHMYYYNYDIWSISIQNTQIQFLI